MAESLPRDMAPIDQAAVGSVVQADTREGAVVHTFDPDAPPEEKAAAALKARPAPQSHNEKEGAAARAIQVVSGKGSGPVPPPTITVSDMDAIEKKEAEKAASPPPPPPPKSNPIPGDMPDGAIPQIPDWYKVGWRAVGGIDDPIPDGEALDKSTVARFLNEAYYGEWYHNAGVIFFAVAASHYITLFRLGWGWLFILLAFCATYYSTSITRVRRNARDDIQRELVKTRLGNENESAEWMNYFLQQFWINYENVMSKTIIGTADQVLSASTPPFLDSIRLTTFTLGNKAPRIDYIRTLPSSKEETEDEVVMDWGISFIPNDVSDITPVQASKRVNPKIVLSIRLGKGLATAAMPILLEDLSFSGRLRIKMKLVTNFPHVQTVAVSFIEPPTFDYVLKPLGGEHFGFDVGNIPGLSDFIRKQVHWVLKPLMYDPHAFTLDLQQLLSGTPLDTAVGVLQIHVDSARQLKAVKLGGGIPDPYVAFSINNRKVLDKTKFRASTFNPHFGSTHFLLLTSSNLTETLNMNILDHNEHRKDTSLGISSFELRKLLEDATQEGLQLPVLSEGKEKGELSVDLTYYPVLTPKLIDGKPEPLPETNTGIVRLIVHHAKELDTSKSMSGDLNPFAKVFVDGKHVHSTPRFKHTVNPVWESPVEFLVPDKTKCMIAVEIVDDRDFLKDPKIGYMSIGLQTLLKSKELQNEWFALSNCKSGRVRLSAEWKPLEMAGIHGANQYKPPIGIVRLWVKKAEDLKNVESTLGGKSDPYVRVMLNNIITARTEVVNNNLYPEWDQIVYVPVHSLRETLFLECMDYQHLTKDRSLGSVELKVSSLAKARDDPKYPFETIGKKPFVEPVRLDKNSSFKGKLHFVAEFVPSLNLKNVAFESEGNELERALKDEDSDVPSGDEESISSSDEEENQAPTGEATIKMAPDGNGDIDPVTKAGHKSRPSTDTAVTSETAHSVASLISGDTAADDAGLQHPKQGVEMTNEQLLRSQSGIIVFNIISGKLSKKARLEVLLEDGYWPVCGTRKARGLAARWDEVGEGFIKELEFGRVWLRLNENDEGEKEDIIGEFKVNAKAFLEQSLNGPTDFELSDNDGQVRGTVQIASKFIPVDITLEPREMVTNMGVLHLELLEGKEIHGADRSGKSDPFVVFYLNNQKVFKSQTKKKTLAPVWNENFEVLVPSRVGADFALEVFDWNQVEQAKSLGIGKIEVADLEPMQLTERAIPLSSVKHGDKGEIRVRMLFRPEMVARSRGKTSTFSTAGRAVTQIGGLPLGAGRGLAQGVGHAGHKAFGIFKKDKGSDAGDDGPAIPQPPSTQVSNPVGPSNGNGYALPTTSTAVPSGTTTTPPPEFGSLHVTVMGAKDLVPGPDSVKPYAVLKCGDKEYKTKHAGKTLSPDWEETFTFNIGPDTRTLNVGVYDHKTIGRDRLLGETDVEIWKHLQPGNITSADVDAELRDGLGLLQLRLGYEQTPVRSGTSLHSTLSKSQLGGSPSRFSMSRRHVNSED